MSDYGSQPSNKKWKPAKCGEYTYTPEDRKLLRDLETDDLNPSERSMAVKRLSEVATAQVVGNGSLRVDILQFCEVSTDKVELFEAVIDISIDTDPNHPRRVISDILAIARQFRDTGDVERYTLLSAAAGYYPPTEGDDVYVYPPAIPASVTLDPYYDQKHDFRVGSQTHLIGAVGNSG